MALRPYIASLPTDVRPTDRLKNRVYSMYVTLRCGLIITSGQSNLTKRPHRRRTLTVQSYLPGCANMHPRSHMLRWPTESTTQTASRLVQYFFTAHGEVSLAMLWHVLSPKIALSLGSIWTPSNTWFRGSVGVKIPHSISIGSAAFAHCSSRQRVAIL